MKRILIGSTALKNYIELTTEPKDIDYFCNDSSQPGDNLWHPLFDEIWPKDVDRVATPNELITITYSHLFWDLRNDTWWKHLSRYRVMQHAGFTVKEEMFKILYKVWINIHGPKQMNLDQDTSEFFDDAVKRKYVHDSLHVASSFFDKPQYEAALKDGATVDIDPAKMWALPEWKIILMLREEIAVTALERIMVPKNYVGSPGEAYLWALRRCATSLFRGKTARFLLDNIEEFVEPHDYMALFNSKKDKLILL